MRCVAHDRDRTVWVCTRAGLNRLENGRLTGFTKADGFPANGIQAALTGRDGSLWIATNGGVVRRRGGVFETITHTQALQLHEDRAGNLWIGGFNNISRLTNGRLVTYGVEEGVPAPFPSLRSPMMMPAASGSRPTAAGSCDSVTAGSNGSRRARDGRATS